jgi:hypothetical protein
VLSGGTVEVAYSGRYPWLTVSWLRLSLFFLFFSLGVDTKTFELAFAIRVPRMGP